MREKLLILIAMLLPLPAVAQGYVQGFGESEVIDVSPPPVIQESEATPSVTPDASDFYTAQPQATGVLQLPATATTQVTVIDEHSVPLLPEKESLSLSSSAEQVVNTVIMQGLNKVNGHISTIEARLSSPVRFDYLEITPYRCWKSPPEEREENAVLLEIREIKKKAEPQRVFLGWMFSSSPGLSGLEHPLYDIRILSCAYRVIMAETASESAKVNAEEKEATGTAKKKADTAKKEPAKKEQKSDSKKPAAATPTSKKTGSH